ncbi:MAG: hypothetical protein ACKV2Q_00510, partial [Planctomycetaceae bacterium]
SAGVEPPALTLRVTFGCGSAAMFNGYANGVRGTGDIADNHTRADHTRADHTNRAHADGVGVKHSTRASAATRRFHRSWILSNSTRKFPREIGLIPKVSPTRSTAHARNR